MEDIIGILAVLAIGIIKIIGKNLDDSGKKPVKTYTPVDSEPFPETKAHVPYGRPVEPEPVAPKASTIEVVERQTMAKTKKPILIEEEEKGPKEKIDPKKLVLYSEIMTPKFNE